LARPAKKKTRTPKKSAKKSAKKSTASPRRRRRQAAAGQGAATGGVRQAASATTASGPAADYRAKVRMYRQGLGDCFLISLPRSDGSGRPFYVMIDCGVVLGTSDPGTIMTKVMDHIVHTTGGQIDVLVATHGHWDHLSGFVQAKATFEQLKIGQVWLAWTEDPKDPLTRKLKAERGQALQALRMGMTHMELSDDLDRAAELRGILEFFGAAKGGATTEDAFDIVKAKVPSPIYWTPGDGKDPLEPDGTSARFFILGPPHDEKKLRKINPSAREKETYGLMDGLQLFLDGAVSALAETDASRPFDRQFEIPFAVAQTAPELKFFRDNYWQPQAAALDSWRRIDGDWLDGASDMALQLDSLTNNTSLAIAIELAPGGDVLLFAADAQVGNWLSWQDLKWKVGDAEVTGPDLLERAIFYKVGHHGSHNATLKKLGLEQMKNLRVAMIPVDQEMAKKKRWGKMPLEELVTALNKQAKGAVLQVDKATPTDTHGEKVVEDPLFYEVTF
jgi:hypothetical protein